MRVFISVALAAALAVSVLGGCSSSTDPGDGGPATVIYNPDRQFLDVTIPNTHDFSVSSSKPADLQAVWKINGVEAGVGTEYTFQSGSVGSDTLTVDTTLNGQARSRDWLITILPSASLLPPAVTGITIEHGQEPMDVVVSWLWINQSAFPITDYLVACSYAGPVTVENWDDAQFLGSFPQVPGQAGYSATFTADEHGMLPATTAWFAVRGRDDRGQMSPILEFFQHTISFAWWIEGTVYDSFLQPLPEVIIDYGCGSCRVNTDVNGFYRIGPFRDVDLVDIYTISRNVDLPGEPLTSWYDFQLSGLAFNEVSNTHDIYLVNRFGTDPQCPTYGDQFLAFLRQMTKTDVLTALREDYRLYKWPEYPVKVYIPPFVRADDGLDFEANSRLGMGYWNLIMQEDYFVEVTDPAQAQIEFYFADIGSGANGRTELAAPQLPYYYSLGDVIPEKINVGINTVILPNPQRVQETALHELGHALGLYEHVDSCADRPYLMNITSSGVLDGGWENAIHIDEIRMLRAIRYLPQGVDMGSFLFE